MAFQPINFAGIAPLGISGVQSGMQMGMMPAQEHRRAQAAKLSQALQQMKMQNMPEEHASQMALRAAQANQINAQSQLPFGGRIPPGTVGQEVWLDFIKRAKGENSDLYKHALDSHQKEQMYKKALMNRYSSLSKSMTFRGLPADEKRRMISTAVGMGVDPAEAARKFVSGETLQSMADTKNMSLNDVTPVYPLQGKEISNQRNRGAFVKELNFLDGVADDVQNDYSRKFYGYSPTQLWDALKNENPDKQGKMLAFRAISPEIAALRLKAANSTVGIEAINEMQNKALTNSKIFEPLVSGEARVNMNRYINKWLKQASDIFSKTIEDKSRIRGDLRAARKDVGRAKRTMFDSRESFLRHLKSLSEDEQRALQAQMLGER